MKETVNITDCNFNKRDFCCFVFENKEDRHKVLEFLAEYDSFEHEYCPEHIFTVGNLNEFQHEADYVGKYEPDLAAIADFCNKHKIKFVVYNETKELYYTNTLTTDEKSMIEKGKKHWDLNVLKENKGGYVDSATIKQLIGFVIENTWKEAKDYYLK